MTKKGYQKRLPTVLPPTLPAPRASPEELEPAQPVARSEPVAAAMLVAARSAPESEDVPLGPRASQPVPAPVRRRISVATVGKIVPTALVALVIGGLFVFRLGGDPQDPPTRGSVGADGFGAPPMLTADESYAESEVLMSGEVVVHQWIRSDEPLGLLRLALPEVPGAEGLSASEVEVLADDAVVAGPASITGAPATYTFDETTDVRVRYVLTGAVERSDSAAGRALAVATTLDVGYAPRTGRETRVVMAPEVLSLACSPSPEASAVPCGRANGTNEWRVELTGPRVVDRVLAQLTLG